jgi:hypothetical protein
MTKVRRLIDDTLHVGPVSYLIGSARTGVPYPVLEDVLEGRYKDCVTRVPFDGARSLFYRIHEPTQAMRLLATDTFPSYRGRRDRPVTHEAAVWGLVRLIYRRVFSSTPHAESRAREMLHGVARGLSEQTGDIVSPLSLAAAAGAYRETGALVLSSSLAALASAVIPASLLVIAGVPRQYVACFGVYYQDPTVYRNSDSRWVAGVYLPSPTHTVLGVYLDGRWVLVDFTRQPRSADEVLPQSPRHFLHSADFGSRADGNPLVADYAHPYTVVFPPPAPGEPALSPVLKHVPLLELR